jgi:hypothetical protein
VDDATAQTTQILWPDKRKGPYLITSQWRLLDERWQMVGFAQTMADEAKPREMTTEDARALRLPQIRMRAAEELRRQLRAQRASLAGVPQVAAATRAAYRRELEKRRRIEEEREAARPRRGRPPVPLAELVQVGRIYMEAFGSGKPPTKTVGERLQISYAAASKRVASCRRLGILGPGEQGKPGSTKLWGRGSAASTKSIRLAKEIASKRSAAIEGGRQDLDDTPGAGESS